MAPKAVARFTAKIKDMLRQGRGRSIARTAADLASVVRVWICYDRLVEARGIFEELAGWMRRRLRCVLWRQWKRPPTRAKRMMQRGIAQQRA